MKKIPSASIIVCLAACAVSSVEPLTVPLVYKASPTPDAGLVAMNCPALARIDVTDRRTAPVLGTRFLENKPLKADVTAANDPVTWAREGVQQFMVQDGVKITPTAPALSLGLDALRTSENIWHRAGYEARIVFAATLRAPSGKICWQETVEGKGGNYGYAGSIVDYQETLNAALDAATLHMLNSSGLNDALCHCAD